MAPPNKNNDSVETSIKILSSSVNNVTNLIHELLTRLSTIEAKIHSMENQAITRLEDSREAAKEVKELFKEMKIEMMDIEYKIGARIEKLDAKFVSKDQFEPIRRIVYAVASAVLLGVFGAILNLVLKK